MKDKLKEEIRAKVNEAINKVEGKYITNHYELATMLYEIRELCK